jgi:hypothetical protein
MICGIAFPDKISLKSFKYGVSIENIFFKSFLLAFLVTISHAFYDLVFRLFPCLHEAQHLKYV